MKKAILSVVLLATACMLFAAPPIKKITVTVKNECDWDVPVGLGRGVNSYFFNEKEKEKVTWQRVPPKGQVVFKDVLAGFDDYTFFVLNETTERYSKDDDFRFVKDTTITLFYDFDNLYYRWKHD